jgi:hypothetical protein
MPASYRVFLGAPSLEDLRNDPKTYSWRTTSSSSASSTKDAVVPTRTQSARGDVSAKSSMSVQRVRSIQQEHSVQMKGQSFRQSQSFVLPKATLEEVSRRISLIYRDLVLSGEGDEDEDLGGMEEEEYEEEREMEDDSGVLESGIFEARADMQDQDASFEGELVPGLDATRSVEVSVFRGVGELQISSSWIGLIVSTDITLITIL